MFNDKLPNTTLADVKKDKCGQKGCTLRVECTKKIINWKWSEIVLSDYFYFSNKNGADSGLKTHLAWCWC